MKPTKPAGFFLQLMGFVLFLGGLSSWSTGPDLSGILWFGSLWLLWLGGRAVRG